MEEGDASVLGSGAVVAEVWVGTRGGRECECIGQRSSGSRSEGRKRRGSGCECVGQRSSVVAEVRVGKRGGR